MFVNGMIIFHCFVVECNDTCPNYNGKACDFSTEEQKKIFDWLKKADECIEKSIPMKPTKETCKGVGYGCPRCNEEIYWDTDYGQQEFKHCTECGQALDWSEKED